MRYSNIYKAQKGLIRVNFDLNKNRISNVRITGDFFLVPEESISRLEKGLNGKNFDRGRLEDVLNTFYSSDVDTPLITKEDFINAILGAKNAEI
jgi:hypothetical protein